MKKQPINKTTIKARVQSTIISNPVSFNSINDGAAIIASRGRPSAIMSVITDDGETIDNLPMVPGVGLNATVQITIEVIKKPKSK